jgi:predicted metal-dependent hydrolase
MPRRWGSFTTSGRILLNPGLIRAPTPCIDYVIVHELAHPDHGPAFYEVLAAIMPDW